VTTSRCELDGRPRRCFCLLVSTSTQNEIIGKTSDGSNAAMRRPRLLSLGVGVWFRCRCSPSFAATSDRAKSIASVTSWQSARGRDLGSAKCRSRWGRDHDTPAPTFSTNELHRQPNAIDFDGFRFALGIPVDAPAGGWRRGSPVVGRDIRLARLSIVHDLPQLEPTAGNRQPLRSRMTPSRLAPP